MREPQTVAALVAVALCVAVEVDVSGFGTTWQVSRLGAFPNPLANHLPIEPVYLPEARHTTELQEYTYPYEYYAAGPSRVTVVDGIHRCVHCDTSGIDGTFTYCPNCGAIACTSHSKTERLEGEPICTGCAVTERFALKTKYFYDEENLEAFREEYDAMPIREKAMENKPLVGGMILATLLAIVGLLVSGGVI